MKKEVVREQSREQSSPTGKSPTGRVELTKKEGNIACVIREHIHSLQQETDPQTLADKVYALAHPCVGKGFSEPQYRRMRATIRRCLAEPDSVGKIIFYLWQFMLAADGQRVIQ